MPQFEIVRSTEREYLRAVSASPIGVDRERRKIHGIVLAEKGPFASGRGKFDDNSLNALVELARAAGPKGWASSYGHHPDKGTAEALGSHLGRVKNVRLDGDKVRGDLHLANSAFLASSGPTSRGEYLMARAEEDPSSFGTSLVLTADKSFRLDARGRRQVNENGEPLAPVWTPTSVLSSDVVSRGDACPSGFMAATDGDELRRQRHAERKQELATDVDELRRRRWTWAKLKNRAGA